MKDNLLTEMQPLINERLGRFYNRDTEYKQAIKNESELFKELEETLSKEQLERVKNYQLAICSTWGICEMIAYKQGMKDMATLIGIDNT